MIMKTEENKIRYSRLTHWNFALLQFYSYCLPLSTPWHYAAGVMHTRAGFLIAINKAQTIGWGDAAPLSALGTETLETCQVWLKTIQARGISADVTQALHELPPPHQAPPAARCALESALLDIAAQMSGQALATYLAPGAANTLAVNVMLGTLNTALVPFNTAFNAGFRCFKFKVGVATITEELAQLHALAAQLPTGIRLRLDANRAWNLEQAQTFLTGLIDLPVEWVEEPLRQATPEQLNRLRRQIPVPLALDESLPIENPEPWLAAGLDAVVLKPMRLGGLLPALHLARRAHSAGLSVVVTSSLESAIGRCGAAHLAAACDTLGIPMAHGLATDRWLAQDVAPPLAFHNGYLQLPIVTGLGCHPDTNALHCSAPYITKRPQAL